VAERVRAEGVPAEACLLDVDGDDDAGRAICEAAGEQPVDLIVMSAHGHGGRGHRLFGDVAERVLCTAEVPVLLIPATSGRSWTRERPLRILVRLDDPEATNQLVALAADLADTLILLRVVRAPARDWYSRDFGYLGLDWEAELAVARHYLSLADRLRSSGHAVEIRCVIAAPAFDLARFARDEGADLIAVTAHGRADRDGLMLGGVATAHLQRAEMPLLLTRHVHGHRAFSMISPRLVSLAGGAGLPRHTSVVRSPLPPNVRVLGRPPATDHSRG
jgi:nucleotide-binding universal stress UspA family protein